MPKKMPTKLTGLTLLILLTASVVVGGSVFLNYNFNTVNEQEDWVRHTYSVTSELDLLLSSMKDAETGVRGYMLTGDSSYLTPYTQGSGEVWGHIQQLKTLLADNATQLVALTAVENTVRDRLKILQEAIESMRAAGRKKAEDRYLDEGRTIMDLLRTQIVRMRNEEQRLLNARKTEANRSEFLFHTSLALTTVLTLLVMLTAFARIRRDQIRVFNEARVKERESWQQSRIAEFSQMLTDTDAQANVAKKLLNGISRLLPVAAANLYWRRGRDLVLVSSLGMSHNEEERPPQRLNIEAGGLVAEAFRKKEVLCVRDIPKGYFKIASSTGQATPNQIILFPLFALGEVVGVIELASFEEGDNDLTEFFKLMGEPLGSGLNALQAREELQQLLEKTQQQAEELQTQQEELRTSNEELEQQSRALESQQQVLEVRNHELEEMRGDIERKANDLERASQYKSDFLAKMSHELRTPLNSLLIMSTLLTENKERTLSEQQIEFAKAIGGAGNDLLTLINDILDLSKIEARKLSLRAEKFSLEELFAGLKRTFSPQADSKHLKFVLKLDEAITEELNTDRLRLEQILRNLLSNAIKFTEHGQVTLSAQRGRRAGTLDFIVEDTGVGVSADKQDLIFQAFEQADGSVSRKFGGTGLGLTISRELAHLLGGEVSLVSREGHGSVFTLTIPEELAAEAQDEVEAPRLRDEDKIVPPTSGPAHSAALRSAHAALSEAKGSAKTILIVEDDETFCRTVATTARSYGFAPIQTDSGEVALEVLKLHVPSAILLDIKLPGISGMGVLERIKRRPALRHVPIHMISAMDHQHNALRMGAMGYLGKPVTLDKVREALGRIENLISRQVKQLLVVEDDKRQREAIMKLVQGHDIEIRAVATGEEALKAMQNEVYDCVILDLALPDISGFDLLEKLGELQVDLPPIVIYTAQELTTKQEDYLRKYSESIIIKGTRSPERLLDEVNLFLHRVESQLPEDKRAMLEVLRSKDMPFTGKEVLVVDDDLRNIFALTSALEGRGCVVTIARDGIEAVAAAEKGPERGGKFDAILMDLMMPRMDGLEAIRRIRKLDLYREVPIVALTAKAMKEDHERCIEAGATDYLPKPIDLKNLFSVLNVWVRPEQLFT